MYATIALDPKTSHGHASPLLQPFLHHPLYSQIQYASARIASDHPALTSTNELVHIFLFSGNQIDHTYPIARHAAAAPTNPSAFAFTLRCARSHNAVSNPSSVVPSAGISLNSPSGSRTLCVRSSYKCPGIRCRSTHATIF